MCRRIERRFESRPESVPEARHLVAWALRDWGLDDADVAAPTGMDLLLVASELVTNAAKSHSHDFLLSVDVHRDHVELVVADEDPEPARRMEPGLDQANGRGLGIVDALASSWGQTPFDGHIKRVWCRLDLPPGSALGSGCAL
ncbi:MAG TPA: ATP-binding protein [Acidimicrobiales bacterium]|nr:ATP-binding protein [Acidimicrobiales bacterium]